MSEIVDRKIIKNIKTAIRNDEAKMAEEKERLGCLRRHLNEDYTSSVYTNMPLNNRKLQIDNISIKIIINRIIYNIIKNIIETINNKETVDQNSRNKKKRKIAKL